jgi:LmbE family N-acetylglucosaminyl deacetylase
MRHASLALALTALLLSSAQAAPPRKARPAKAPTPPPTLDVPAATRLLVIAPHPDDEVLGAGGLMQRVHATGGAVRVVYLTDGEGYPEGVMETDHTLSPTVKDYLGYGKQRRREARNALVRLGLADAFQTFLGYPDGGLCKLTRIYWSERRGAFRSPYTRLTRPPKS